MPDALVHNSDTRPQLPPGPGTQHRRGREHTNTHMKPHFRLSFRFHSNVLQLLQEYTVVQMLNLEQVEEKL